MPGIDPKKSVYSVWLLLGIALFGQGLITGGGVYGSLVTWQVDRWGVMLDPLLGVVLFGLVWIAPPSILLLLSVNNVAVRIGACGLAGLVVIGFLIHQSPDGLATPIRIDLDGRSTAALESHTAKLTGTLQNGYSVSYEELHRNVHRRRSYVPLTQAGWSSVEPVHFLVQPEGDLTSGPRPYRTGPAMMLSGGVPGYVRNLLERRGVLLADDLMVQVDLGTETDTLYVLFWIALLTALLGFALAFVGAFLQPLPALAAPVNDSSVRMDFKAWVYLCWLVAGLAIALHDFATGGGLYGALAGWSIRRWGSLSSGMLGVPLAFALLLPPVGLLFIRIKTDLSRTLYRGGLIVAGCLFAVAAGAYLWSYGAADPSAPPIRVELDAAPTVPGDHSAIVVGELRPRDAIAYTVYTKLAHHRRVFVPLTPTNWRQGEPVRFLAEPAEIALGADRHYTTGRGMLLSGQVPGYVRALFESRGIRLSDDVMLHTYRRGQETMDADAVALSAGFGGFLGLVLALGGWPLRGRGASV